MNGTSELRYEVQTNGTRRSVQVRRVGENRFAIVMDDGEPVEVEAFDTGPGNLTMLVDGRSWEAGLTPIDEGFVVDVLGIPHEVEVIDPRRRALRTARGAGGGVVRTQMPGRVVRVLVEEGQAVDAGQPVVVVEAMKMENELKAPVEGTVRRVHVRTGDVVEARAVLVEVG